MIGQEYRNLGDSPEIRRLARDVIRWECRPYPTMHPPPLAYFLKTATFGTFAVQLFRQRCFYFCLCTSYTLDAQGRGDIIDR